MKKTICVFICIVLITLLFAGCNELTPTDKEVVVKQSLDFNLANHLQFKGYITLNAFEEKLYFTEVVSDKNGSVGSLSVFSNGGIEEIRHWDNVSFIGFYDEYLYYFQDNNTEYMDDEYMDDVYCYSLKTQEEKFLTTVKMLKDYSVWWFEGGTLYIPTNFFSHNESEEIEYRLIVGDEVKETLKTELVYQVGDRNYTLKGFDNEYVYCISNGERQNMRDVIGIGDKSLIPCETGLLVYNQTHKNLLYFLDFNFSIWLTMTLFSFTRSTIRNIFENSYFLSFTIFNYFTFNSSTFNIRSSEFNVIVT